MNVRMVQIVEAVAPDEVVIEKPGRQTDNIETWLGAKGLSHLLGVFVAKGYTDLATIRELGLDKDDIHFLGITDVDEQALLMSG